MPHHGLIQEIEQDLERLALAAGSSSQPQGGQYMQQAVGYPAGGMAYGPAVGMPYQQPVYGMQTQPVYGAAPMTPYGRGYVDSGDGRPAMIYGGPYEGMGAMPSTYRQGYPAPYQQGYAAPAQPWYAQSFPPGYPQPYPPATQVPPTQAYAAMAQALAPAPVLQSYAPAAQLPPQPAEYRQASQPGPPACQPIAQPSPQPVYSQAFQTPVAQASASTSATQLPPQPLAYPVASQSSTPAYQLATQPSPQPVYSAASQAPPGKTYEPTTQAAGLIIYPATPPFSPQAYPPGSQSQYQSAYVDQDRPLAMTTSRDVSTYLNPDDTRVRYELIASKVDNHHHALKSLVNSSQSPEALTAILGSYLAVKQSHQDSHGNSTYSRSRPEVQTYNHVMDKLEALSADYISKHKSAPSAWTAAMGPHRRHIFAQLYNSNELVRAFALEMSGGPMMLPELDTYALGTTRTMFNFTQATTRSCNLNAALSTLSQVRTVVLIDDSGSMTEPGHLSWGFRHGYPETRWHQARNLLSGLAPLVAMHNPHGIDLHFLNRVPFYSGLRTSRAVESAFDGDYPNNGTPTGQRVNDILDSYMCTLRYYRALMPLNLIIITDGEAQDEDILHWTIEHHVTKIVHRGFPAHQFGVEFVQVGDCEFATRHLEKLEKEVSRHHRRFQRDVVGVTPTTRIGNMDPEKLLAIAVSGIDARLNGYMRQRGVNV